MYTFFGRGTYVPRRGVEAPPPQTKVYRPLNALALLNQHRLAAFLQAGLLVPAQEESLTVKATRSALAKLDVDPSRLLN